MVNNVKFGVRIDNFPPIGRGSVQICYDQVKITVEYSQTPAIAGRSSVASDTKPMKEPIIFPNPFTTKAIIQFTASESGKAVVELFNINGAKTLTLFSKNVVRGQMYNVDLSGAQLSKGVFIYRVINGDRQYIGRIIKLE